LMVILLIFASVVLSAKITKWHQLDGYTFENYVLEYNKIYSTEEYQTRKALFEKRLVEIKRHNADPTKTWKNGVNQMTDWTEHEFRFTLGYKNSPNIKTEYRSEAQIPTTNIEALPTNMDWRTKGIITPVKDQGMCGSCWTFGAAEVVESYYAMANGQLPTLSEQAILDCVPNPNDCGGTGGCGGGTPELAYAQLITLGGMPSEWTYPYISYFGSNYQCHLGSSTPPVAKLSGYKVLPSNQYQPVLTALATIGPLAINVDASAWSAYESGVFDGCNNTNPDIDHVVQLVGYGTNHDHGGDYWLVRNSWAPSWGEGGYIKIKRTNPPRCGVDLHPQDGTGCNGGPKQVTVCGTCGILYDVSYPVISK